jgi:Ca2+-binding EF-hand superfamily protein
MIELREFGKIVELLHHYNHLSALFTQLDTNGDHKISFNEFKKGFELMGEDHSDENHLKKEFNKIDTNKGGFILFDEVRYLKV